MGGLEARVLFGTSVTHRSAALVVSATVSLLTSTLAEPPYPAVTTVSYRTEYYKDWHPLVKAGIIHLTRDESRQLQNIGPAVKALVLPQGGYITTPNLAIFKRDKSKSDVQRADGSLAQAKNLAHGAHDGSQLVVFFLATNFAYGRAILDDGLEEGARALRRGFQDVAEGKFDRQYGGIAEHLVKIGMAPKAVIRLGHEFNGD